MNLTHEVLVIAMDPPLVQWPHDVLEWMRRRHVLEPVEEGDDKDIDIPLRNFMEKKIARKPKRNDCCVLMNYS